LKWRLCLHSSADPAISLTVGMGKTYRRVLVTEPWLPYGGFIHFHLLLVGIAAKGYVSDA
jgi:hypothetical protein